ncbi:serine protease [Amycolatopsis balhimycina DSM 5908]|uniref:Serine protease n=1 Tax=Amycolatopsis balhimycina DSM 5908 TaxID=1081091 RepID=A0A428WDA1_AMYBA|nr:trypsin-like peptidase domain-containing protein [Amycolatopsis balhimycina]RSM41041.1 serine protease [Amycolatopsis balhimycina DSM 5908]
MGFERERRRWRVRLHDELGRVCGAGTVLDEYHVLTSAHVVETAGGPRAALSVDFVGLAEALPGAAAVVEGCWVPSDGGGHGDLALLRLERPESRVFRAPLHRMPLGEHQLVRVFGFPPGSVGRWMHARLGGPEQTGGEWVRLFRTAEAESLGPGFGGTAVLDEATGHFVGMVVGKDTGTWMVPVETMLGHLPQLSIWASGGPAVDASFSRPVGEAVDVSFVQRVVDWFAKAEPGTVWVVDTGEAGSPTAAALRFGIVLADRERSLGVPGLPPALGPMPPAGSVDLAVDATGRTADAVRHRIADRLTTGVAGRTLVVDAIDDSAEPDRLVGEVLAPLAGRAAELGLRLLLGFREESSPGVAAVRASTNGARPAPDDLAGRLEVLTKAVEELAEIEAYQLRVATRFTGVAMLPARAQRLRSALKQLRSAEVDGDAEWVERHIDGHEHAVAPAVEDGRRQRAVLDGLVARREELRARLAADNQLAREQGLLGDPDLEQAYLPAKRLLIDGPCELTAAATAVDSYAAAVRARIEDRG